MSSAASPSPLRRRLALLVRVAVALSLLSLLYVKIPWRDRVVLTGSDGATLELAVAASPELEGELEGIGPAEGWRFEPAAKGSGVERVFPPAGAELEAWGDASGKYEPGLGSSLGKLSLGSFTVAFFLALAGTITASARWKVMLGALGFRVPLLRALRLNLAGLAASQVLLGSVGGDVVKGALVARDEAVPENLGARTSAVMALMMDRVVGLAALLAIGTTAALTAGGDLRELATWFGGALALLLLGVVVVLVVASRVDFSAGTNPILRVLHALHGALVEYRRRPGALAAGVLLSFGSHSFLILAIASLGVALGMDVSAGRFFLLIPIVETAQAVPISPAGWGVAESMYVVLFQEAGETASTALSLALAVRAVTLSQALMGVPGLVLLVRKRKRLLSST